MPQSIRVCPVCQKEFTSDSQKALTCSPDCRYKLSSKNRAENTTIAAKAESRFWSKVQRINPNDCWEWPGAIGHGGYGISTYRGRSIGAHRLAYFFAHKELPENLFICHKCDNPKCVNPAHLWAGTPKDNTQDCVAKGRLNTYQGKHHWDSPAKKLTSEQVNKIRELYATGSYTQLQLSKMFDVDRSSIGYIVRRDIWNS